MHLRRSGVLVFVDQFSVHPSGEINQISGQISVCEITVRDGRTSFQYVDISVLNWIINEAT